MNEAQMAARLSRYGDVIIVFVVVQDLAFAYKLGQTADPVREAIVSGGYIILSILLAAAVGYSILVAFCAHRELLLRRAAGQSEIVISTARLIGHCRVAIVIFSTFIAALGLWLNLC